MDKQEQKYLEMTQQPVAKLICSLAVPCIISMLVTAFYNMADTFFVVHMKPEPKIMMLIKKILYDKFVSNYHLAFA